MQDMGVGVLYRRISKHVKDQNWTAIFLDFLIVVVGVFIGIQVANLNEAGKNAAAERLTIERLKTDFDAQEQLLMTRKERAEMLTRVSGELLQIIRGDVEPADRDHVKTLIFWCLNTSFREAPPASYSELLASGALSDLGDKELREALILYGQSIARWDYIDGQALSQSDEHSKFRQAIRLTVDTTSFDSTTWSLSPSVIEDYDWEKLKQADVSISTIQQQHWQQLDRHHKDLSAVKAILSAINRK